MLRIVLRATWLFGKIKNKASGPHPSLDLLPNGVHTCILVCLCLACVSESRFLESAFGSPASNTCSLSLKGGILCIFSKMSDQSVSETPWQGDMERLGFCNPDVVVFEKKILNGQNVYTHAWAKSCCARRSQTLLVVATCEQAGN